MRELNSILIAEDDECTARALYKISQLEGFKPVVAYDGKELIRYVEEDNNFCVIIADNMMPGIDGISALGYLRENGKIKTNTLVYLITGGPQFLNDRDKFFKAGASLKIKPINYKTFFEEIKSKTRVA